MSENSQKSDARHPLDGMHGLPPEWIAALKVRWITSAEEVLALAATPEGRSGLEASLPPNSMGIDQILKTLTDAVGVERAQRLSPPTPGGHLGAKLTDAQKKQFGIK